MAEACARGALLVGSVPLDDEERTFKAAGGTLGGHLKRIPDGEPGERNSYTFWQHQVFEACPEVKKRRPAAVPQQLEPQEIKQIISKLPDRLWTKYDEAALASWKVFQKLQATGDIPTGTRFQVCLPTPVNTLVPWIEPQLMSEVEPLYGRSLFADAEYIQSSIPHDRLAIQWDAAMELLMLERQMSKFYQNIMGSTPVPWFDDNVLDAIVRRMLRCMAVVHDDVEVGLHLCYGDAGHQHFTEPKDLGYCVAVANGVIKGMRRPLTWVHMPVPKDRDDDRFFAPLRDLDLNSGKTELYLGLVHFDDEEGTRRRISAARKYVGTFGVATECGMGRTPVDQLASIFEITAAVSQPWA